LSNKMYWIPGERKIVPPPGSTDFTTSALVPLPVLAVELQEEIQSGIWNGPGGKDPVSHQILL
jgi:hypothetical protein